MTEDQQLWACALEVERQHGENASQFAFSRADALDAEGAFEGARTWRSIQQRICELGDRSDRTRQ
ncbi:hypothetical protein [Novosphingobium sp. G106]|uniref:DUF6961 family protein n=1 Tax=Novosphingobium sp. G106 TaxID=2849500 RepID=UPI0035C84C2C